MSEAPEKQGANGTVRIRTGERIDLETLPALKQRLQEALADTEKVVLEVPSEEVPLSLVQLICAAHRSAADAGREFRVEWGRPGRTCDLLHRAGFTRHVACPRSTTGDCLWLEERWT